MDENADDSQVISEPPPESWRRPPGWPRTTWMKTIQGDLSCVDLELHEARELAQNRPLWRLMSLYSAMHSQWCMLMFRVHILLLIKRSGTFSGLSRTSKTFFQRHSLLHVYYWTYCTWRHPQPTHLTKYIVHKDAIPTRITYGTPNISQFIATFFQ